MTARITNRPPSLPSAPRADAKPAPAPAKPPAKPAATDASSFEDQLSAGVRDASVGVRDASVGVRDASVGVRDHSVGLRDHSVGTGGGAGGIRDHSVGDGGAGGIRDHSVGTDAALPNLGPNRSQYEQQVRSALKKYLEVPSYLRDSNVPAGQQAQAVKDHVAADPHFRALSPAQQKSFWTTFDAANTKGKVSLGALLEGTPDALTRPDTQGTALVDNLSKLATQPLNSELGPHVTHGQVLDQLITTIANPDEINQGSAPTCTVTSMQFELARDNPSEYARLVGGLTGPGSATMVGGGTLEFNPGSAQALDGRDLSEAVFQSAAMDFANGGARFDPVTGENVNLAGKNNQGLSPSQQTNMLGQLFGVTYKTDELPDTASRARELQSLKSYVAVGRNRPVLMEIDQGTFNHAVTFEMMKDSKIYFRDPYGTLRSMTQDAFLAHIVAVHKPADLGA